MKNKTNVHLLFIDLEYLRIAKESLKVLSRGQSRTLSEFSLGVC